MAAIHYTGEPSQLVEAERLIGLSPAVRAQAGGDHG
jgi:hypothetical protein